MMHSEVRQCNIDNDIITKAIEIHMKQFIMLYMPFSRRFHPKRHAVMCAYSLHIGGPGNQAHYPGVTSAVVYQWIEFE